VPFDSTFALAFAGWVLAEALTLGYEAVAAGAERPAVTASAQAASGAILLVFLGGLAATRVTPERAVGGLFVASAVKLAVQAGVWRGYPLRRSSAPAPGTLAALGDALPFFLLGTLAVLYYRVDLILLHAIRGALETATYAAAYRVVDAISIVGLVIFAALAPHFSRLHSSDPAAVWPEWQRYARRIGVACVAPAAVLILATPSLVGLLFGRAYATSAPVLRLLVPGVVFMLLSSLNGAALLMGDGKRTVIGLTALSLGLNVVVTAIGAAAAGAQGAAVATTVSEIATCALAAGLVRAQARGAVGPGQGPEASAIMPGQ
jgi:O-antigen/teichoic acid export membrane protein